MLTDLKKKILLLLLRKQRQSPRELAAVIYLSDKHSSLVTIRKCLELLRKDGLILKTDPTEVRELYPREAVPWHPILTGKGKLKAVEISTEIADFISEWQPFIEKRE